MEDLVERILQHLSKAENVSTLDLAASFSVDHQKVIGALKSIQASGDLLSVEPQSEKHFELTEEGVCVAAKGMYQVITL